jgi:hypothetical protein
MLSRYLTFVVISVLVAGLVYSSFSFYVVVAEPQDPRFGAGSNCTDTELRDGAFERTCCWREPIPGSILGKKYCQTCTMKTDGTGDCKPKEPQSATPEMPTFETKPLPSGDVSTLEPSEPVLPQIYPQGAPPITEKQPPLEQDQGLLPEESIIEQQPPSDQGTAIPTQPLTKDPEGAIPPEPATEGPQPTTVEEEQPVPVCQEGLEFNEDLGFCVPTECPEGQELNEETGICVPEEQPQVEEPTESQSDDEEQTSNQEDSSEDNN